ncbi:MAG: hypothetical protein V3V00_13430 [Saprospiraceae bacterium]
MKDLDMLVMEETATPENENEEKKIRMWHSNKFWVVVIAVYLLMAFVNKYPKLFSYLNTF